MIKNMIRVLPSGLMSAVVLLAISYFSLAKDPIGGQDYILFEGADKVAHFLMYLTAAIAFIADAVKFRYPHSCKVGVQLALTVTAITVGLLMEVGQLAMNLGRLYDHWDILANSLGAVSGFALMYFAGGTKMVRNSLSRHRHHHHHHH